MDLIYSQMMSLVTNQLVGIEVMNPEFILENLGRFAGRQCDVEFVKIQENSDFNVKKKI
jgi:hypothetical protein